MGSQEDLDESDTYLFHSAIDIKESIQIFEPQKPLTFEKFKIQTTLKKFLLYLTQDSLQALKKIGQGI